MRARSGLQDICDVKAKSPELRLALEHWVDLMLVGDDWPKNDAPWWYNERASVSQLAGAIWRCRPRFKPAWVLEEYAVTRLGTRGAKETQGRCDLMLELGKQRVVAEAKQIWFSAVKSGDCASVLQENLANAKAQVVTAPDHDRAYKRYALAFVVPFVRKELNDDPHKLQARLQKVISSAKRAAPRASMAWAFPARRRQGLESPRYPGTFYPGCVLVLDPAG